MRHSVELAQAMAAGGDTGGGAFAAAAARLLSGGRGGEGPGSAGLGGGLWDARGRPELADLLASALGARSACLPKSGVLRADDALRRLLGTCGLGDRECENPAAADPAACKAVLLAAEACLDDAVLSGRVEARPLLAAPTYIPDLLIFAARLRESLSEAPKSGLAVEGGGMEVLQERLLGVLGSLVCATLFPPEGLEPLRMFCCAYVEPPSPSSAKRGAARVGEGDAVEGETGLSAAELRARGQEDFGVLVNILLQDAAAAAQCLPWALDLFEKALGLRSALAPSVDAASGPAAPGHGQGIRPAAGLFFALADRVCALLPGRRGDEKPDRSYARELEMLGALLAWMLASRERLAPLFGLLREPFQRLGAALVGFLRLQADLMEMGSSTYDPRAVDLGLSCLVSVLDMDSRVVAAMDHTVWLAVWSLPRWRLLRELEGGGFLHEDTLAPPSGVGGAATRLIEAYCGAGRSQKMIEDWTLGQEALWERSSSSPSTEAEKDPRFVALGLFRPALVSAAGRALAAATPWASVEMVQAVTARLKHGLATMGEGGLPSFARGSAAGALVASLYTGGGVLLSVPHKQECAPHLIRHCLTVLRSVAAALDTLDCRIADQKEDELVDRAASSDSVRRALLPPVLFVGFSAALLLHRSGSQEAAPSGVAAAARTFPRPLADRFKLAYAMHRAQAAMRRTTASPTRGSAPCVAGHGPGALKVVLEQDVGPSNPGSLAWASAALARAWDPEGAGFGSDAAFVEELRRRDCQLPLRERREPASIFMTMVLEVAEVCKLSMSAWNGVTVSTLSIPSFMVATLLWGPGGAPGGTTAEDDGVAVFESLKGLKATWTDATWTQRRQIKDTSGIRHALSQALRIGFRANDAASLFFASAPSRMRQVDSVALRSGCIRTRKRGANSRSLSQRAKRARVARERRQGRTRGTSDPDVPGAEAGWDDLAAGGAGRWGLARAMLEEDVAGWSAAARARHGCRVVACLQSVVTLWEGSAEGPGGQPRCDLGALLEGALQRTDLNFEPHAQVLLCHAATLALAAPGGLGGPEHDGGRERLLAAARAAVGRLVARSKRFKFLEGRLPPAEAAQTR